MINAEGNGRGYGMDGRITQYLTVNEQVLAWQSENQAKAPQRCIVVDDKLSTVQALHLVRNGTALLWQGDFIQAKQLLAAMGRKIDQGRALKASKLSATQHQSLKEQFHLYRLAQTQKAQLLGKLLIRVEADFSILLRRAPNIQKVVEQIWHWQEPFAVSLRELLGVIGAYEWRKQGVAIPCLGKEAKIYPFYGVFSPIRGEYLDLVANAPLPAKHQLAMDIGCGTGVLAAILAKRGVNRVIATDISARAIECARFNMQQLKVDQQVTVVEHALFPPQKADLIICNPPWLPAKANTSLEAAVYDPQSSMLRGFLQGLAEHLNKGGQGWLIISNLAEVLGLRSREELLAWIEQAGLVVITRYDTTPKHKKINDLSDPLNKARQQEITSLWVLCHGEIV